MCIYICISVKCHEHEHEPCFDISWWNRLKWWLENQRGGWDAALSFAGGKSHCATDLAGPFPFHLDQGSTIWN